MIDNPYQPPSTEDCRLPLNATAPTNTGGSLFVALGIPTAIIGAVGGIILVALEILERVSLRTDNAIFTVVVFLPVTTIGFSLTVYGLTGRTFYLNAVILLLLAMVGLIFLVGWS